jgi:hypothetical protein
MPTEPLDEQAPRCRQGAGAFALFAALCVICVDPCFYRLTAVMAEKLGYISAHGAAPGHRLPATNCERCNPNQQPSDEDERAKPGNNVVGSLRAVRQQQGRLVLYQAPKIPTLTPVLAGLDPAIGYPQPIANGAIPISNQPMTMTGSGPVMTWLDRCVGYVNSKGGW